MFQERISLASHSHYRIGGPASYFFEGTTVDGLIAAVTRARQETLPCFILGGGTNILFRDEGFDGLVVKPVLRDLALDGVSVSVGAGVSVESFLDVLISKGLSGFEWAGGLPGTMGGAIRGNAGCFGGEAKDALQEVVSLDISKKRPLIVRRSVRECRFGYRDSVFKRRDGKEIILRGTFLLSRGNPREIRRAVEEKIEYRRTRHPVEYPNIGSIFKNVDVKTIPASRRNSFAHVVKQDPFPVVPAAYLLAEAGLKGVSFGGAMISPKHPNFIVNVLHAKASDVQALIALAKQRVRDIFGIQLEEEIIYS